MTEWTKEQQKANRKKLVEALRSGKYVQGECKLRAKDNKFDVLGVACDLAIQEGVVSDWKETENGRYSCEYETGILPHKVRRWLGFKGRFGRYVIDEMMFFLADDNDHGVGFEELADIIESEPKELIGKDIHDRHKPKD